MADIFNITNGSFCLKTMPSEIKPSVVTIDGISDISALKTGDGLLVSNFAVSDREKSSILQCFGGRNHVYAFGHDPDQSAFSVTFFLFLGKKCMEKNKGGFEPGELLKSIVDKYNEVKVSNRKATVQVSLGGGVSYTGIVLAMSASVQDAEINLVSVTVSGKIVV